MGQIIFKKKDKAPAVTTDFKKAKAADSHGYLKLRVKHKIRKEPFFAAFGQRVEEKHWDHRRNRVKPAHPNATAINHTIDTEEARVKFAFTEFVDNGGKITEAVIQAVLSGAEVKEGDFLQFMKERIEFKATPDKQGKMSVSQDYLDHLWLEYDRLYKYTNGYLPFESINLAWLEAYQQHLSPRMRATTLSVKMKRVMEYVSMAVDRGHIEAKAIAGYKKPDYLNPDRQYLNAEQVDAIANLVYKGKLNADTELMKTACFFVVECYSGLRFSDWPRFTVETVIDEPALRVRAKKNNEYVYLYLNQWPKLKKMCDYIKTNEIKFDLDERDANTGLRTLRHLAEAHFKVHIGFEFTTHNGRHTAATFLALKGYNDNEGSEILGISPGTFGIYRRQVRGLSRLAQQRHGGI